MNSAVTGVKGLALSDSPAITCNFSAVLIGRHDDLSFYSVGVWISKLIATGSTLRGLLCSLLAEDT